MKKIMLSFFGILMAGIAFAQSNLVSKDYFNIAGISSINLELTYEDVKIEQIYGQEVTIEIFTNNNRKIPSVSLSDGTLLVKNEKAPFIGDRCTVCVYVPQELNECPYFIKTSSGDVVISNITSTDFTTATTSGDIRCIDFVADGTLLLKSTSGDIDLKNATATKAELQATSGDLEIVTLTADEIICTATSGDIEMAEAGSDYIRCATTSGGIKCGKITCDYFDMRSTSGSIILKLLNEPEAESVLKTTSGSIALRIPKKSHFEVEVTSNSGRFEDDLSGNTIYPRRPFYSKYNGGGSLVKISTTSGSINLDD